MTVHLPIPEQAILARRAELIKRLHGFLDADQIITREQELKVYETDGLTAHRQPPLLVVLQENTREVTEILRLCSELEIKVVPRSADTSLSGGALPLPDGIVLTLGRFNRILDVDFDNRCVVAQSGVTNSPSPRQLNIAGSTTPPIRPVRLPAPSAVT